MTSDRISKDVPKKKEEYQHKRFIHSTACQAASIIHNSIMHRHSKLLSQINRKLAINHHFKERAISVFQQIILVKYQIGEGGGLYQKTELFKAISNNISRS